MIRAGRPNLDLGGYVQLLNPLPETTVAGSVVFSARVDAALGATAVDFIAGLHAEGQPTVGYITGVKSGDVWTASAVWDSTKDRNGAVLTEDYRAGIRVRVTSSAGVKFTQPVFVTTANLQLTGSTPAFSAAKSTWAADYTSLTTYLASFHTKYGADATTTSIVTDPIPTGQGGHINHGKVASVTMPESYPGVMPDPQTSIRWQVQTAPNITEGMEVWYGCSYKLGTDFAAPTSSHIAFFQMMGADSAGSYGEGLRLRLDARTMTSLIGWDYMQANELRTDPTIGGYGDPGPLFRMPLLRDPNWFDFVVGFGVSRDIRKGWLEMRYRLPGMTELKKVEFYGIPGLHRIPRVLLPANAAGQRIDAQIYRFRDKYPVVSMMIAKQKMGPTPESVDPHSYGGA